jgi:hypothetical protein
MAHMRICKGTVATSQDTCLSRCAAAQSWLTPVVMQQLEHNDSFRLRGFFDQDEEDEGARKRIPTTFCHGRAATSKQSD